VGEGVSALYFASPEEFRRWLEAHHATEGELWVGFHKRASGVPSPTWPESVDEALCFGWIDGVRRSVDAARYAIRFTPRRPRSIWSAVNLARARELVAAGRMQPAGLAAFEGRDEERTRRYSYERREAQLGAEDEERFRAAPGAWEFYLAQPPWYRRTTAWWVTSAKREATRRQRLERLIADSAAHRVPPPFERKKG